jgi:antitoxin ParD1/3/4
MQQVEKISIALTSDMLADVKAAVESGAYATVSEVIRDALRNWRDDNAQRELARRELGRLIDAGHASGSMPYRGVQHIIGAVSPPSDLVAEA